MRIFPQDVDRIRELREEIRIEEGGGGMCAIVSEVLYVEHGWEIRSGVYTTKNGEVICEAHLWNVATDGTLIDATADQFGEGHDIRIIAPDDPDYPRYREEWYQDWNPDVAHDCPRSLGYSQWAGELDIAQASRLKNERGDGWWLNDKTRLKQYQLSQEAYAKKPRPQEGGCEASL